MVADIFDPQWKEQRRKRKPEAPPKKSLGCYEPKPPPSHHFTCNKEGKWICERCDYHLGDSLDETPPRGHATLS